MHGIVLFDLAQTVRVLFYHVRVIIFDGEKELEIVRNGDTSAAEWVNLSTVRDLSTGEQRRVSAK